MVSTSGAQLLPERAIETLISRLLPVTSILTPNIPEANLLLRKAGRPPIDIQGLEDLKALAAAVHALGPKYVLLKGGHCPLANDYSVARREQDKRLVTNILYGGATIDVLEFPFQASEDTHGTGCSLACMVPGPSNELPAKVLASRHCLQSCIEARPCSSSRERLPICRCGYSDKQEIGAWIRTYQSFSFSPDSAFRAVSSQESQTLAPHETDDEHRGGFIDYVLDRFDVQPVWNEFTHHDFVAQMGNGTLPIETYKHYMIQDYLYLVGDI